MRVVVRQKILLHDDAWGKARQGRGSWAELVAFVSG